MGDAPKGIPMKYPYTLSAKIAQFPFKFLWNNIWMVKYTVISIVLCSPLFYQIQKLSYAPENVAKFDEKRRQRYAHH